VRDVRNPLPSPPLPPLTPPRPWLYPRPREEIACMRGSCAGKPCRSSMQQMRSRSGGLPVQATVTGQGLREFKP
jgi:hypothetical protein